MNLERELEHALGRRAPAPGFAQRVLARIDEEDRKRRRPTWWRAAAASVTLAAILGGYTTYRVVEIRRGERAKEQLLVAMRIAGEKVSLAREQVRAVESRR
ncbi:MAG TPA: hypothetical protein VJZ00_10490 [Thermoanaerobaculia bacterium]|nr:hypothetical protein [Thermoanaerobaculia bacterium]